MIAAAFTVFLLSDVAPASPDRAEFEVASIRPKRATDVYGTFGGPGSSDPRYFRACMPLSFYIQIAYEVDSQRYSGPTWADRKQFALIAKAPAQATKHQLHEMMQVLLERRFRLKLHFEGRQVSGYRLVVAKGGSKLKSSSPASIDPDWRPPTPTAEASALDKDGFPKLPDHKGFSMVFVPGGARVRGYGQSPANIAGFLTGQVGRRVVDSSGLQGHFDYTLAFSTWASRGLPSNLQDDGGGANGSVNGDSVFGAIEKQLGLRLEAAKVSLQVLVVDSIDRLPSEN